MQQGLGTNKQIQSSRWPNQVYETAAWAGSSAAGAYDDPALLQPERLPKAQSYWLPLGCRPHVMRPWCVWESCCRSRSRDRAASHTSWCLDRCICSSSLLPFQCQGRYYSWLLHRPRKSPQHSSLSVPAKRQSL